MNYFSTTAVKKGNRFLTLHAIGKERPWRFPGGKLDTIRGESPINAAVRELKEEVGITPVSRLRFLGVQHVKADGRDWIGYRFFTDDFVGRPSILEPHKHDGLDWLTESQLNAHGSDYEVAIVKLSKLTPIQERILFAMIEFEKCDQVSNEQIAARLGIEYHTWQEQLRRLRNFSKIAGRKDYRPELAAWWRSVRGAI